MECPSNWEYKTLIDELTQGKEQAKQLKDQWSSTSSSEVQSLFLQRIISSFEKSLLILNWNGSAASQSQHSPPLVVSGPPAIESSMSVDNSPRSENLNAGLKDQKKPRPSVSKKRKTLPTWTEQVRVSSEHGLEGPSDDGYSWRKYGQKDILGAKFPRSYYRCTYRHVQNCWATKYVQRSDDDPTVFDITYKGSHTCYQSTTNNSVAVPPVSPEKQEMKPSTNQNSHQLQQPNEVLINFRSNLRVNTGEEQDDNTNNCFAFPSTLTYIEGDNHQLYHTTNPTDEAFLGTYSPAFVSPTTPESNYFSMSNSYMNSLGGTNNWQHYESDLTDIISANASVTNSPNAPLDIPIDHVDLDPNFPFNMSVLFT